MSHWIDSSSKFKWDCAHVGIRHIKEGSVILKPLLWTNSSLVPSLFLSVPTYFTRSPCKVSSAFLTSTSNSTPLDSGQYRGEFWSFLLPFWLRAMALFPFEEPKKKNACYLKTLQLVSLARLLQNIGPPRSCYLIQCFREDLRRDLQVKIVIVGKSQSLWEHLTAHDHSSLTHREAFMSRTRSPHSVRINWKLSWWMGHRPLRSVDAANCSK